MLGAQLLVSNRLLQPVCAHTRFDPPSRNQGRLGGLRRPSHTKGAEMDDMFVTAYAPQEVTMRISHSFSRRLWTDGGGQWYCMTHVKLGLSVGN